MKNALLLSVALIAVACGASFAEDAKTKPVEFGRGAKNTMSLPETWKTTLPETGMRSLEAAVPKQGEDKDDADLSVIMLPKGGGVAGNLPRWKGQFGGEASLKAERKLKTASGVEAYVAELEGPYKGMTKDGPMTTAKEGYKMLGVIITTDGGEFYIKLIGPKATIDASKAAFDKAIESFK